MVRKKRTLHDKYYHLAKEHGYRSRAAFKLIQLNKKYNFLTNARGVLDLCAAPGGWLQVVSKYVPTSTTVIGVDLLPMKPIRNVILLVEDITTERCRAQIKKHMKSKKVDVVLHDGAPSMGAAWAHDAYAQSELTLHSLRLAVDTLNPGGWFVTKVFRSGDYNSLLWVFNQLFKTVTVTKPPASRNTSAEIYVVCAGFLAPKHIDPRFLDPAHVFKELSGDGSSGKSSEEIAKAKAEALFERLGSKRVRNREGYEETGSLLFRKASAADFITTKEPIRILADNYKLVFDEKAEKYARDELTTYDIRSYCEDLKVLGKREIKHLLRWRLKIRDKEAKLAKADEDSKPTITEEVKPLTSEEREALVDIELESKVKEALERARRREKQKLKKKRKRQAKIQRRIDMKMILPEDQWDFQREEEVFKIDNIKKKSDLAMVQTPTELPSADSDDSELDSSDDDSAGMNVDDDSSDEEYDRILDNYLEQQYEQYLELSKSRKTRDRIGKKKKQQTGPTEDDIYDEIVAEQPQPRSRFDSSSEEDDSDNDDDSDDDDDNDENPLLVREPSAKKAPLSVESQMWFSQDMFNDVDDLDAVSSDEDGNDDDDNDDDDDEDDEDEDDKSTVQRLLKKRPHEAISTRQSIGRSSGSAAQHINDGGDDDDDDDEHDGKRRKTAEDEFEVVPVEQPESEESDLDDDERAELLALGQLVKTGKRKWDDLVDDGFNRYSFNDTDLPTWFSNDEDRHNKPIMPITKEMVEEIKARMAAINARPIKKVAEAKARKKMRETKKLEKVKAQATSIANDSEMTESEKARALEKLYKKQSGKMKQSKVYVVRRKVQKGKTRVSASAKSLKAAKGPAKILVVDKRMKKDKRANKAQQKRANRKRR